eukprot:COSAG02_NODE_4185_length_5653_cov_9.004861_3_plen_1007_part_00
MSLRRGSVSVLFDHVQSSLRQDSAALTEADGLRAQSLPVIAECRCAGIATREERLGRSMRTAVKGVPQAIAHREVQRQYTVYEFVVTDQHGESWQVEKRFSEIKQFKKDLISGGVDVVKGWELPSKLAVTKSQRKMAEETIIQRKAIVETFLSLCVSFCGGHPLVKIFFHPAYEPLLEEDDGDEEEEENDGDESPAAPEQLAHVAEGVPPHLTNLLGATLEEPEPEPEQEPDSDEESEGEQDESTGSRGGDAVWATNGAARRGSSDGSTSGANGERAAGVAVGRWTVSQLLEDQAKFVPAEETRQQLRVAQVYQSTLPTQVFDCVHVQKRVARRRETGSNMRSLRLTSEALVVIRPPERISAAIQYVDVLSGRIEGDNFVMLSVAVEGKRTWRRYQCGRARDFVAELSRRVSLAKHITEKTVRCSWADKQSEDTVIARQSILVHASPSSDSEEGEGWSAMTGWDLDSLLEVDRSSDDSDDEGDDSEAGSLNPAGASIASDQAATVGSTGGSQAWQVGAAHVSAADAAARHEETRLRSMLAERMHSVTGMTEAERLAFAVDKLLSGEKSEDQQKLAGPIQKFVATYDEKMASSADTAIESTRQLLEKAREIIMALRMDSLRPSLVEMPLELVDAPAAPQSGDSKDANGAGSELAAANTLSHIVYGRLESAVIRPLHNQLMMCFDQMARAGYADAADFAFEAKRRELRAHGQDYYGIPAKLQSPSGWAAVISKLNAISSGDIKAPLLPSKQLASLMAAASSVYSVFASEQTSGKAAFISGDDFLPIFIYIVVQSKLKKLSQMWHYMYYLADPVLLRGEGGYYLGVFEAAMHWISNWSPEDHNQVEPQKLVEPELKSGPKLAEPEPEPVPASSAATSGPSPVPAADSAYAMLPVHQNAVPEPEPEIEPNLQLQKPAPEAEPEPGAKRGTQFNLVVKSDDFFPGQQRECSVFARDLTELATNVAQSLAVSGKIYILLHDDEFDEFFLPNSISEIAENSCVQIKSKEEHSQ